MTKQRFKVGVIGLGARAEMFVRQLYAGTERGELFGICDIDEDRAKKFCDFCEIKNVKYFSDPLDFFKQKEMDAVVITTPDFAHLDVATLAFKAGKHVFIEKPLEVTGERAREIIRRHRRSKGIAYVGFNLRASAMHVKMKALASGGTLGQLVHVEGMEQLLFEHGASFMRRFHRHTSRSGGLLNTKCCHDLDQLLWYVGHEHKVVRVASFGGTNVFVPQKAPAKTCRQCPPKIYRACPYKDKAGYVFPVRGPLPIHKTRQTDLYGGDLCVYTPDKDIVDNQTVIFEWDNGVRGNYNLQLFQMESRREFRVWGDQGVATCGVTGNQVEVKTQRGETSIYTFQPKPGGHGGNDPAMLGRFFDAIERGSAGDCGLSAGLAATILAEKALKSLTTGKVVNVAPDEYL